VAVELDLPGVEPGMTMNGGVDPRRVDHLVDNTAAANIELTDDGVATLDMAVSDA
jgi:hypothetical protein